MENAIAVCKFTYSTEEKSKHSPGSNPYVRMKFTTQYDPTLPEDQRFCKATPSGDITMVVDNPVVSEKMELGQQYYVYFVPVPKKEEAK